MHTRLKHRLGIFTLVGLVSIVAGAAALRAADAAKATDDDGDPGFVARIVDESGKPVKGAKVTTFAYFDRAAATWRFDPDVESNVEGLAQFEKGSAYLDFCCVSAFDLPSRRAGMISLKAAGLSDPPPAIVLRSACAVRGKLICSELVERKKPLGWTNIYLNHNDKRVLGYSQEEDGQFELILPPGQFDLEAYGSNAHFLHTPLSIKPAQETLDLGNVDLPATRLARLEGESAPPLRDIVAWKNGPGVELADLRGKWVLLDFWGHWCGPCVGSMPDLMNIHEKYKDRGVVVIGVHVDSSDSDEDFVDTAAKLDAKLIEVRKELWQGRDLPFPIALIRPRKVSFGPRVQEKARCQPAADYGVIMYPTQVLIDRTGKVVGKVETRTPEGRERLGKLLEQ